MKCPDFDAIVVDLACERRQETVTRAAALAHAAACPRCEQRLLEQGALTADLRSLGAATAHEAAPEHVRRALRTAFHAWTDRSVLPTTRRGLARKWYFAAAAGILILISVAMSRRLPSGLFQEQGAGAPSQSTLARDALSLGTAPVPVDPSIERDDKPTRQSALPVALERKRRAAPSGKPRAGAPGDSAETEVATEFIPLTYLADSTAVESGHVVRVQIPRSALVPLGLAFSMERQSGLVTADVVLGDDGLARAIRLVY